MTKKDYVTFARMIRSQRHQALMPSQEDNQRLIVKAKMDTINSVVDRLCEIFKSDNPQFNEQKFIQACTLDTESK